MVWGNSFNHVDMGFLVAAQTLVHLGIYPCLHGSAGLGALQTWPGVPGLPLHGPTRAPARGLAVGAGGEFLLLYRLGVLGALDFNNRGRGSWGFILPKTHGLCKEGSKRSSF